MPTLIISGWTSVPGQFSYLLLLQLWGLLLNFDWLAHLVKCPNVKPLIVIYRRGNLEYHHWVCTLTYRPLSHTSGLDLFKHDY